MRRLLGPLRRHIANGRFPARALRAAAIGLTASLATVPLADARPLGVIQNRGVLSLCAHANALPFSSRKLDPPGFQIELGRALAGALGVTLVVEWVTTGFQFRAADCDIILDTIAVPEAQEERNLQLSRPYQRSGVGIALRPGTNGIAGFADLTDRRVAVQSGSLAAMLLGQRGARTVPYGFEEEMVAAVAKGDVDAAAVSPATVGYFNLLHREAPLVMLHSYDAEPELSWNLTVGLRRSDSALRQAVDRAIERLMSDGTVSTIYSHYGIAHRPPTTP